MIYLIVSIWIIFVIYKIVRLNILMKKTEERMKQFHGTTLDQETELKKRVEEEIQKRNEFEQKMEEEILELLKGYADNKIEFNLRSLLNYFEENRIVFTTKPYSPDEYGINIVLYNYNCNVVCKIIQGFSLVKITQLAIIDQK